MRAPRNHPTGVDKMLQADSGLDYAPCLRGWSRSLIIAIQGLDTGGSRGGASRRSDGRNGRRSRFGDV